MSTPATGATPSPRSGLKPAPPTLASSCARDPSESKNAAHGSSLRGAATLQYLIARIDPNGTSLAFALTDVQGRFSYDFSPGNKVTLYLLESYSSIDRTGSHASLGVNSLATGAYNYTLANLGWRFTPSPKLVLSSHAAWMREKYDNYTPTPLPQARKATMANGSRIPAFRGYGARRDPAVQPRHPHSPARNWTLASPYGCYATPDSPSSISPYPPSGCLTNGTAPPLKPRATFNNHGAAAVAGSTSPRGFTLTTILSIGSPPQRQPFPLRCSLLPPRASSWGGVSMLSTRSWRCSPRWVAAHVYCPCVPTRR